MIRHHGKKKHGISALWILALGPRFLCSHNSRDGVLVVKVGDEAGGRYDDVTNPFNGPEKFKSFAVQD